MATETQSPETIHSKLRAAGWELLLAEEKDSTLILVHQVGEQILIVCPEEWDILRANTLIDAASKIGGI